MAVINDRSGGQVMDRFGVVLMDRFGDPIGGMDSEGMTAEVNEFPMAWTTGHPLTDIPPFHRMSNMYGIESHTS